MLSSTPVIATRNFQVGNVDVPCRLFSPCVDGNDFRCNVEIGWPDGVQTAYGMGIDGVQALLSAMVLVRQQVLVAGASRGETVKWLGMTQLGLPAVDPLLDEQGYPFDRLPGLSGR